MVGWRSGGVEELRSGGVEELRSGGVELRRSWKGQISATAALNLHLYVLVKKLHEYLPGCETESAYFKYIKPIMNNAIKTALRLQTRKRLCAISTGATAAD